jgi:3-deoxy-D-manno-oct-2-ulosonic acid (Kdo) hydroxylase
MDALDEHRDCRQYKRCRRNYCLSLLGCFDPAKKAKANSSLNLWGGALIPGTLELGKIERWAGPFPAETRDRAVDALEDGLVIYFPRLAFTLEEQERCLLSPSVADGKAKNVSLDPASGSVKGAAADADRAALQTMLERFASQATRLVSELFPAYVSGLERARTSYRPVEITGRSYSPLKDDKLLHVDAFPSTPTQGRRILRLFTNIAPAGQTRIWRVGEPFQDFARKFLPSLPRPNPLSAWFFAAVGATKSRRSPYDQLMLALHDGAKRDAAYQKGAPQVEIGFPPGTTWLCYTDQVLHAALAGQFALEQTFHLELASMVDTARSPLKVLEGLAGRPLAS